MLFCQKNKAMPHEGLPFFFAVNICKLRYTTWTILSEYVLDLMWAKAISRSILDFRHLFLRHYSFPYEQYGQWH